MSSTNQEMGKALKSLLKESSKEMSDAYLRWLDLTTDGKRWPKGHPND